MKIARKKNAKKKCSKELDWGSYIISVANLLYGHAWNTVVMSGLVLLVASWNCWLSYKNGYAGLLVFHFLPLLNPWLIVEM